MVTVIYVKDMHKHPFPLQTLYCSAIPAPVVKQDGFRIKRVKHRVPIVMLESIRIKRVKHLVLRVQSVKILKQVQPSVHRVQTVLNLSTERVKIVQPVVMVRTVFVPTVASVNIKTKPDKQSVYHVQKIPLVIHQQV